MARKEASTILGSIVLDGHRKRFRVNAPDHIVACLQRLTAGTQVAAVFHTDKPARTRSQLSYHWVLLGHLSDETGHTTEELQDYAMRAVFGEKLVTLGDRTFAVRRSMAAHARMNEDEAAQLIEFDLELCRENSIVVPTKEELGYLPS